ncbi:MAG: DNA-3-methyladenine glycosylase I [Bacteroidales bacterium]
MIQSNTEPTRCPWCLSDPVYLEYHDSEWGFPSHDDHTQFQFLVLESAQAGLSWLTILKRREGYRSLYENFDPERVARFDQQRISRMLADPSIIRNRMKIEASVSNAQKFLNLRDEHGSFCDYLWTFMESRQTVNRFEKLEDIPATTALSDAIAKDMKKRGFRFLGSTILYAHLQATGLVNDHLVSCDRHSQCIHEKKT